MRLAVQVGLLGFAWSLLASCGSGAVSNSAPSNNPAQIVVLPANAVLYSGLPTTFQVSGGTGIYTVASSDQSVVPLSGNLPGNTFTVIPNAVATDTPVTVSVRDSGATPVATAVLTIHPNTVSNSITITPTSTQGGSCTPAVCSGGDAGVSVLISQGGQPLPNRAVRFEAVSGDFRFITSPSGASVENTDLTTTVITDEAGIARARLRVNAAAPNQTAVMRIVDVSSGASRTTSFTIAQATGSSPGFFATPTSITFTGPDVQTCASNVAADVAVFGGTPPYYVTGASSAFTVAPLVLYTSGSVFSVAARGVCVASPGAPITVTDISGRTTSVTVANVPGTAAVPALVVAPDTVALTSCTSSASVSVAGGTGTYVVNSSNSAVLASLAGNTITIRRVPNSVPPASATVGVTSGAASKTITVNLSGGALTNCQGGPLGISPTSVMLACGQTAFAQIFGGTGSYTAVSSTQAVVASVSGSTLTLQRASPSVGILGGAGVAVTDGFNTVSVAVSDPGGTANTCP